MTKKIQKSAQAHTKHKIPSYMKFKSLKNLYFKNKNSAWYVLLHTDILRMERQFDTLVAGLADVVENLAVTVHNGNGTRHQQVVRVGEVHVDRTAQTAVEELEVDTEVGRIFFLISVCQGSTWSASVHSVPHP